jgi:NADH-quinone oxidoreductase subunit E
MEKIDEKTSFQNKDHQNLLVLLKKAQEDFGYVTEEAIADIARSLDVSISDVYGVTTFYSFLSKKPLGKYVIRICQSLPCYLKDSPMIIKCIEDELGIKPGETTPDGKFSLQLTNCIGACDRAPAMLINDEVYGDLTPERISQIVKEFNNREQ